MITQNAWEMYAINTILCSTGSLGYRPDLLADNWLIETATVIHSDGFELMLYRDWAVDMFHESPLLCSQQVFMPVVHLAKQLGEYYSCGDSESIRIGHTRLRNNCALAQIAGADKAVLHLWGLPCSDDNFEATLTALPDAIKIAQEHGLELLVETIPCRTQPLLRRMDQIVEACPDCRFTIDTRMLCHQGVLERLFSIDWLWEEGRIAHLHVSDCQYGNNGRPQILPILHPGEGIIDFEHFFIGLKSVNYHGAITLESPGEILENGKLSVSKLNKSLDYLRCMMQ